ncbi:type VI secretion system baseplate subunit TssE [Sphingomonas sp.]|uniref:type VI secretion system baseplate subunit TssE n=1 Tax=Sphingomonas sp. TaxID=28214 RepID=UPI002DD6A93C|nr:type VI secretion system baseplate subunit TssE [Sphingomonas sp.]
MAVKQRLTPSLFDKLVSDLEISGLSNSESEAAEVSRENFRYYSIPKLERFNEAALRSTVRREVAWLLNTTNLEAIEDLEPYPQVQSSVLNYGVPDLSGKVLTRRVVLERAREIRKAIRLFEPRFDRDSLTVEPSEEQGNPNAFVFTIHGDIAAAVQAMPVKFRTELEPDTAAVDVRE